MWWLKDRGVLVFLGGAALLGGLCFFASGATMVPLSDDEEASLVAGWFSRCPSEDNSQCPAECQPYTGCTVGAGGQCVGSGGAEGCTKTGPRKRCTFSYSMYDVCENDWANQCGMPSRPTCYRTVLPGGSIECKVPSPNKCISGGSSDCGSCA
jgi:hypothetical protein